MAIHTATDFLARVEAPRFEGDCHRWLGGKGGDGYGGAYVGGGRNVQAHRLAYLLLVGPIPEGMQVHHDCDNRICVNPAHLSLGTPAKNAQDKAARGRARNAYTWGRLPRSGGHAMNRTCATPNCNRTTDRPNDPETAYRYCADCTRAVLRTGTYPTLQEPVLLRLARDHKLPAKELVA